ncbi:hypothetical protein AKI39_01935 [Bordetella sp. H567]|uniref:PP0621 family protein n=1 Tax=Bordetella sp. H567 TaxID=1697043 RepID=UPI00081D02B1|nr:PP0621 family protein [Bordetella sp. H567]AOB29706.1 hypothetical protein AKI39_01935 [Bordetella sp. H567]
MGKLLFWIIAVLVALTIARIVARAKARNGQAANATQKPRGRAAPRPVPAEQMVRCAHCGIHLPRSEAALIGGRTWCSQEHARLGEKS